MLTLSRRLQLKPCGSLRPSSEMGDQVQWMRSKSEEDAFSDEENSSSR